MESPCLLLRRCGFCAACPQKEKEIVLYYRRTKFFVPLRHHHHQFKVR
jgi:hypothetical protein